MIEVRLMPHTGPMLHREIDRLLTQLSKKANLRPLSMHELSLSLGGANTYIFAACDTDRDWPENIVGIARISFERELSGWRGKISDVVVDETVRRKGVGAKLMEALTEKAQKYSEDNRAKIEVSLTSNPKRERDGANRLYLKFGFKLTALAYGKHGTNLYRRWFIPKPILF